MAEHYIDDLTDDLDNQRIELEKFRDRIRALKLSITYRQQGYRIFYTVDFSEIYSYLHYGDPDVSNFGVSVTPTRQEGPAKASEQQHYLALTHLFNSFSPEPLYLLQPYTLEMYSYARNQAHHSLTRDREFSELLSKCASTLKPEHQRLLQEIDTPSALTQPQRETLLEKMAKDYPTLSVELLEYGRWHQENIKLKTRGQLLKTMLDKRKVSYRMDELMQGFGIHMSSVAEPSSDEENKVAHLFPGYLDESSRRLSRLLDARAILFLRNINRLLAERHAMLVLITRDTKTPKIAERLEDEEWFGWEEVKRFFFGIETVYIDLILRHIEDDAEKIKWLDHAEGELTKMLESLEQMLAETDCGRESRAAAIELSVGAKEKLERNAAHWNKLTEMEFIRISPVITWLGEDFVESLLDSARQDEDEVKTVTKKQIDLLKNLVAVVDSNEFQNLASRDAKDLWNVITSDVFGMAFLGEITDKLLESLKKSLQEHSSNPALFRTSIERSASFYNMPTINFKTDLYREFVKEFKPWTFDRDQRLEQIGQKIAELSARAANKPDKPESWLFMAFVLGMLDYWSQAVPIAERGLGMMKGDKREFEYFIADAKYREAKKYLQPRDMLRRYVSANENLKRAIGYDYSDARFLERQATIALHYRHIRSQLSNLNAREEAQIDEEGKDVLEHDHAIQLLIQADRRSARDRTLRVRALNNLAFTYATNDPPMLEEAVQCIDRIQKEFDDALKRQDDSLPAAEKWPFVVDTMWYIQAKVASTQNDVPTMDTKITAFETLLESASLLTSERETIQNHLAEVTRLRDAARDASAAN